MDPRRVTMVSDGGGEYGYSEMWPGFQMNYNVAAYNMSGVSENERCGKEGASTSNSNGGNNSNSTILNQGDSIMLKTLESNENGGTKTEVEENSGRKNGKASKPVEPPKDYIHVRARRGQATDSHSLAERARREKISERMKILRNLVPGCHKVVGKALVLDEIINYIQSLQHQVEFLSMKLEAVNARLGIEQCQSKETIAPASQQTQLFTLQFPQQPFVAPSITFSSPNAGDYGRASVPSPEWLHMQIGGGFDRMS